MANATDLCATVERLGASGVHCLPLGGMDLPSPAGKITMQVIAAVAEFERDLLIEYTNAGLCRARKNGKRFWRPPALTDSERAIMVAMLDTGAVVSRWCAI